MTSISLVREASNTDELTQEQRLHTYRNMLLSRRLDDIEIQKLSWGAAHLMGYQDAIGKIQIGYRGDLLLINPPALSPTGSAVIQKVFIDGIPQTIEPPSLISIFWFWKTVSLGL